MNLDLGIVRGRVILIACALPGWLITPSAWALLESAPTQPMEIPSAQMDEDYISIVMENENDHGGHPEMSPDPEDITRLVEQAATLLIDQDDENAREVIELILRMDANAARGWYLLGVLHGSGQDYYDSNLAVIAFRRYAAISHGSPEFREREGVIRQFIADLETNGKIDRAQALAAYIVIR